MVESKSLKLYFNAFRNHQAFHEACTVGIGKTLSNCCNRTGCVLAATGIRVAVCRSIVFWQHGTCPEGVWVLIRALPVTAVAADLNQATSRDRARSNICRSTLPPETITTVVLSFRSTAPLSTAASAAAPPGSTTILKCVQAKAMASSASSSLKTSPCCNVPD